MDIWTHGKQIEIYNLWISCIPFRTPMITNTYCYHPFYERQSRRKLWLFSVYYYSNQVISIETR